MNNKLNNILSPTPCPPQRTFQKYIYNELNRSEKHAFETHINACAFCNDALEGMQKLNNNEFVASLNEINKRVDERVNSSFSFSKISIGIAASLLISLFIGSIYMLNDTVKNESLSIESTSEEDVNEKLNQDKLTPVLPRKENVENTAAEESLEVIEESNTEEIVDLEQKEKTSNQETEPAPSSEKKVERQENKDAEFIVGEVEEETELEDDFIMEEDVENEAAGGSVLADIPVKTSVSTTKAMSSNNEATGYKSESVNKESTVNYNELIRFAQEQVNASYTPSEKKKNTSYEDYAENNEITYSNNNRIEIKKQITQVQNGQYQKSLSEISFQITKDVWTHEEKYTLKWLKAICELKLDKSSQSTLKEIKRVKNPYQKEAKKLYNQLY